MKRLIFLLLIISTFLAEISNAGELTKARPVYVVAHRINGIYNILLKKNQFKDMKKAINAGANIIEADFMADDSGNVFVEHDFINSTSTKFANWASAINSTAAENQSFVGIIFDIKTPHPDKVASIVAAARLCLDSRFQLIYSVAQLEDATQGAFNEVFSWSDSNEGIAIDYSDADPVHDFFLENQTDGFDHFFYGIGVSSLIPEPQSVNQNVKKAVFLRDSQKLYKKVYAWTYSNKNSMKKYFKMGVDGLIVDHMEGLEQTEKGVLKAIEVLSEINKENPGSIRLATRIDPIWKVFQ